ncbi:MAG: hypothetical protein KDD69_03695 [Bdellovibrionales bacterium]|nr:hypothetical protein [Bdellovibrionales bacterium]
MTSVIMVSLNGVRLSRNTNASAPMIRPKPRTFEVQKMGVPQDDPLQPKTFTWSVGAAVRHIAIAVLVVAFIVVCTTVVLFVASALARMAWSAS